jgi:regulator of protease activity HflC (stomatin/prohibitin superfamily)
MAGYFKTDNWRTDNGRPRLFKIFLHAAFWLIVLSIIVRAAPLGTVPAGHRGVQLRFNAVTGRVFGEGLYFRIPFVERVVLVDVRIQKDEVDANAASKDLQTVTAKVALNYHLDPAGVADIYQNVGLEYNRRLIAPALQESVKAVTARFTADELITKRPEVREGIKVALIEKLKQHGILVDEFNIVNFDFSASFNRAIEEKVTAEQEALAAKNKLERVKYEAEQRITQAKGEAEAIRIQAEAIQSQGGQAYVELKRIEKWDGKYPQTFLGDGAVPFFNVR